MKPQPELEAGYGASEMPRPDSPWYQKLATLMALVFCFELGVFLMVFPWLSEWHVNYFSKMPVWTADTWNSPYFRGAVSGVGLLDIYISVTELFRLKNR